MKKKLVIGISVPILVLGMLSNLQWAANNYGYKYISLHSQILAQDMNTGTASEKGENDSAFLPIYKDCIISLTGKANGTVKFGSVEIKLDARGEASFSLPRAETECWIGGNQKCIPVVCSDAFKAGGTFF